METNNEAPVSKGRKTGKWIMTGTFRCSNPDVNQLHHNILWGMKSNFVDVPTDCPQRDERLGWTGDAQIFCSTASYLFDYDTLARKFVRDMYDLQKKNGCLPQIAPAGGIDFYMIGGTGLLGSEAARELIARGHEVTSVALSLPKGASLPPEMKVELGNYLEMTDDEIRAHLSGMDAFVFAAGVDERVEGPAPIYDLYKKFNIDPVKRLLGLCRECGVRHAVICGSYFAYFAKTRPELRLTRWHPYIRSRIDQEEAAMSSPDSGVRAFWVRHAVCCRQIAERIGEELGDRVLLNFWVPDGLKDVPTDRYSLRANLVASLDEAYAAPAPHVVDAFEQKVFGLGVEGFTVGDQEFYEGYAARLGGSACVLLDTGHFNPTENVADKLSSLALFFPYLPLHVTRPMRTSVLEYLETSAARRPESIAVIDETGEYSYRQLLDASRRAGNSLTREDVGGHPVMYAQF